MAATPMAHAAQAAARAADRLYAPAPQPPLAAALEAALEAATSAAAAPGSAAWPFGLENARPPPPQPPRVPLAPLPLPCVALAPPPAPWPLDAPLAIRIFAAKGGSCPSSTPRQQRPAAALPLGGRGLLMAPLPPCSPPPAAEPLADALGFRLDALVLPRAVVVDDEDGGGDAHYVDPLLPRAPALPADADDLRLVLARASRACEGGTLLQQLRRLLPADAQPRARAVASAVAILGRGGGPRLLEAYLVALGDAALLRRVVRQPQSLLLVSEAQLCRDPTLRALLLLLPRVQAVERPLEGAATLLLDRGSAIVLRARPDADWVRATCRWLAQAAAAGRLRLCWVVLVGHADRQTQEAMMCALLRLGGARAAVRVVEDVAEAAALVRRLMLAAPHVADSGFPDMNQRDREAWLADSRHERVLREMPHVNEMQAFLIARGVDVRPRTAKSCSALEEDELGGDGRLVREPPLRWFLRRGAMVCKEDDDEDEGGGGVEAQ